MCSCECEHVDLVECVLVSVNMWTLWSVSLVVPMLMKLSKVVQCVVSVFLY